MWILPEGAPRLAVIFGFHKQARDAVIRQPDREEWNALSEDDASMELPLAHLEVQQPRYYQPLQLQLTTQQFQKFIDVFDVVILEILRVKTKKCCRVASRGE